MAIGGAAAVSLGFNLLGLFTQAAGRQKQTQADQATAAYRAAVARNNAALLRQRAGIDRHKAAVARNNVIIAERAATDARARGKAEAGRQAARTRQFVGRQKVIQAALGQVVGQGSAVDLRADAAAAGKLEELILRANAEREAIGFLTQGMNFEAAAQFAELEAKLTEREAKFTETEAQFFDATVRRLGSAGNLDFLSTLITGAGLVSDKWKQRSGRFDPAASFFDF